MEIRKPTPKKDYSYTPPTTSKIEALKEMNAKLQEKILEKDLPHQLELLLLMTEGLEL